VKNDEASEVRK